MSGSGSLVEAGILAFMRGARAEAERCWREALAANPSDERAREYLGKLAGAAAVAPPAPEKPPGAAPIPSPGAAAPAGTGWDVLPSPGATIALSPHGGVDLDALRPDVAVAHSGPPPQPEAAAVTEADVSAWMQGARQQFALGDFSGSLETIERVLAVAPGHAEALAYLRENEETLVEMYESKLGSLSSVPRVRVRPEEVLWLNLDHRAGFLLAQIDGTVTWDDLFALSNLPRLDTARILARLVDDGVVGA